MSESLPFAAELRSSRVRRGWTAEEAAHKSGISPKTWQRLEDGKPARSLTFAKVDEVFGLPHGTAERAWKERAGLANEIDRVAAVAAASVPTPSPEIMCEIKRLRTQVHAMAVALQRGAHSDTSAARYIAGLEAERDEARTQLAERDQRIAELEQRLADAVQSYELKVADFARETAKVSRVVEAYERAQDAIRAALAEGTDK